MKILFFKTCFTLGLTLQARVHPSSGKASISSGLPLPLQLTWGFSSLRRLPYALCHPRLSQWSYM